MHWVISFFSQTKSFFENSWRNYERRWQKVIGQDDISKTASLNKSIDERDIFALEFPGFHKIGQTSVGRKKIGKVPVCSNARSPSTSSPLTRPPTAFVTHERRTNAERRTSVKKSPCTREFPSSSLDLIELHPSHAKPIPTNSQQTFAQIVGNAR